MNKIDVEDVYVLDLAHPVNLKHGYNPPTNDEITVEQLFSVDDRGSFPDDFNRFSNVLVSKPGFVYISRDLLKTLGVEPQWIEPHAKVGRKGFYRFDILEDQMIESQLWPPRNIHERLCRERNLMALDWLFEQFTFDPPPDSAMGDYIP